MTEPCSRSLLPLIGILLLSCIIVSSGTTSLPLDAHEAYVVQTTREMQDNNNWIVPVFNNRPRLKKPPLNYWLTGATAWLAGSLDQVQPWHGRFASMIAALGLIIFTFLLADKLYNRQLAFISSMLIASSLGLFNYSHDARPDMLYSLFCTSGFTAFIFAWKTDNRSRRMFLVYSMWLAWALATLTKGPHMPAMYLLACLIFSRVTGLSWKNILQLSRPLSGIILFICVAAPWWIMLNHALGDGGLHGTQLSGTLLRIKFNNIFKFYYFYRPLLLVLPWLVFLPFTIHWLIYEKEFSKANLLLGLLILVPAFFLTFGSQERWFYLLPSIVPMIILLAGGVNHLINQTLQGHYKYWLKIMIPGLVLSSLVIFIVLIITGDTPDTGNEIIFSISIFLLVLFLCGSLLYKGIPGINHVLLASLAYATMFIGLGLSTIGWSKERFENYYLAKHAHEVLNENLQLATIRVTPDIYVYYLGGPITDFKSVKEFLDEFRASPGKEYLLIMNQNDIKKFPAETRWKSLYTTDIPGKAKSLVEIKR